MLSKNHKGFTLIELLVIIAIIGILSNIILVNVQGVRERARDTKRKVDLRNIKKALLWYNTEHGGLPDDGFGYYDGGNGWATNKDDGSACYSGYGDLEDFLDGTDPDIPPPQENYIKMPHDPGGGCSGPSDYGGYMYYGNSECARLYAHLEDPSEKDLASCEDVCGRNQRGSLGYGMNYCVEVRY